MKALLIEFNQWTGKRAGNIDPRQDKNLFCYGHQNLDAIPALEIREVKDDRDLTPYESMDGVTVLHNDAEIDAAIEANMNPRYKIANETLFKMDIEQRGISLESIEGDDQEVLRSLEILGVKGIRKRKYLKTTDIKLNR